MFSCLAPFEINVTAQNMQQVGITLTLDCSIKDIDVTNSSLEIVWITNTTILQRTNVTSNGSSVYTDSYTITQLTTGDHGRVIQCIANRTTPPVIDSSNIILNVIGKLNRSKQEHALCIKNASYRLRTSVCVSKFTVHT